MTVEIDINGTAYPVPSSAADTNWAADQVAFQQALADAVNSGATGSLDGVVVRFVNGATPAENRTAIETAISEATVSGGLRKVIFPACDVELDLSVIISGNSNDKLIDTPTNFIVQGSGWNSILRITGLDGGAGEDAGRNVFGIGQDCVDVHISGLHFIGENGVDATGFTYVENNQSSCINFRQDNSQSRCTVTDCYFYNLWGFSVHAGGLIYSSTVSGNFTFWCANGINVNGSENTQSYNTIYNSEGFEFTGDSNTIEGNQITDALGNAISCGGDQTPGAIRHGNQILGNNITGATDPDGGQASGIALSNAICYSVVAGNNIRGCTGGAILVGVLDLLGAVSYGNLVAGNVCINNSDNSTDVYQVILSGTGQHQFINNIVRNVSESSDGREAGLAANYGLVVNADDCYVAHNTIGGKVANYSVVVQAAITGTIFGLNNFVDSGTEVSWGAAATQGFLTQTAATGGTLLELIRQAGLAFHIFGLYGSGLMEWGGGSGAPDTNLYRSGANALRTDDAFRALTVTGYQGGSDQTASMVGKASLDNTPVGNVTTGEDNLMTYSLGADAFGTAANAVRIKAWGTTANNANAKVIKLKFGGATLLTNSLAANVAGAWRIEATVCCTAQDAQSYVAELQEKDSTAFDIETGTATEDADNAIVIKCTGEATSTNDIVQSGMLVEYL